VVSTRAERRFVRVLGAGRSLHDTAFEMRRTACGMEPPRSDPLQDVLYVACGSRKSKKERTRIKGLVAHRFCLVEDARRAPLTGGRFLGGSLPVAVNPCALRA
jgi:hypothetical protein